MWLDHACQFHERHTGAGQRGLGALLVALAMMACSGSTSSRSRPSTDGGPAADSSAAGASTEPGPAVEPGPIALEDACDRVMRILCEKDRTCCGDQNLTVDVEKCVVWRRQRYDRMGPWPGDCEPGTDTPPNYDPVRASACINEIARSTPDCVLSLRTDDPARARITNACAAVFPSTPNTLPGPGEYCTGYDCAAPKGMVSECELFSDTNYGYCSPAHALSKQGESCGYGCVEGLVCMTDRTCDKVRVDGTPCDWSDQCSSDYCDYDSNLCVPSTAATTQQCSLLGDVSRYQLYFEEASPDNGPLGINDRLLLWPAGRKVASQVRYAPKDGSGPIAGFLDGASHYGPQLMDNEYVYYEWDYKISRISFASGQTDVLANLPTGGPSRWTPFLLAGGTMYLMASACEALAEVDLATGQFHARPEVLPPFTPCAETVYCVPTLVVDGTTVYCASGSRIAAFGESGALVLTDDATLGDKVGIQQLEAQDGRLYYLAQGELFTLDGATRTISRIVPPAAPSPNWGSSEPPPSLKLDRVHGRLYWLSEGALQLYDIQLGSFASLAAGELIGISDAQLAVDQDYIYWMTWNGVFRRSLAE